MSEVNKNESDQKIEDKASVEAENEASVQAAVIPLGISSAEAEEDALLEREYSDSPPINTGVEEVAQSSQVSVETVSPESVLRQAEDVVKQQAQIVLEEVQDEEDVASPHEKSLLQKGLDLLKPLPPLVIPKLEITSEALDIMTEEVLKYYWIETSWGIYGIRYNDGSILIAGVLTPNDNDVVRRNFNTEFGQALFGKEMQWLRANWGFMKKSIKDHEDTTLVFLFKGHSHHRLGVRRYSGVDETSIRDAVITVGMDVAVGPLANIDQLFKTNVRKSHEEGTLTVEVSNKVSFHFYYLSQEMVRQGRRDSALVTPTVRRENIPRLPPRCWIHIDNEYYREQKRLLIQYGCKIEESWNASGELPLKVVFKVSKEGWKDYVEIVTNYDFPHSHPRFVLGSVKNNPKPRKGINLNSFFPVGSWRRGDDLVVGIERLVKAGKL